MNISKIPSFSFALVLSVILMAACVKEKALSPSCEQSFSYNNDIKILMERSCSIAGCHVSGFSAGDFTHYEGIKGKADDGSLDGVLDAQVMPPSSSSAPQLTPQERALIQCWIRDNAPQD